MLLLNLTKLITLLSTYLYFYKMHNHESIYISNLIISTIKNSENVFWKLSQWITSRIEFQTRIKDNYLINNLKTFYEKCPAHEFNITKDIIEKHFNKPINEIFIFLQEIPEASGSIGQVHMGILKDGRKVAVKIKHPDIDNNIIYLCWILKYIVNLRFLLKKINFDIRGIEDYLMKQTNFKNEAENLRKLKQYYKNNEYIIIPDIYGEDQDILIMEYIEGENIESFYNKCIKNDNKKDHWEIMIKLWMFIRESILIHNFFHADLHKGNWKINGDKIVIYDMGIIIDNPERLDINEKLWKGFECRSPNILASVISKNFINNDIDKDLFENELCRYLMENMDINSIDFYGDIRNLLDYLNQKNIILNFDTFTYLLAFNLASLNFKHFSFIDDNKKTYFEGHLDRLLIMKEMCSKYNNINLLKQLEKDEEFFINENKEIFKKIIDNKNNFAYEYDSSDSD